jgi:hypothetical protein
MDHSKMAFGEHSPLAECVALVAHLLIRTNGKNVSPELAALAVNLSLDPENVPLMAAGDNLSMVIKIVHTTFDPLLMKFVRNLSETQDEKLQLSFTRHLHELANMAVKSQSLSSPNFLVEVLATMGNISVPEVAYSELIRQHSLLQFLLKYIAIGAAEDDVVLEVVRVMGTLMLDPDSASYFGSGRIASKLFDVLFEKNDDVEIILHLTVLFYRMLLYEDSRGSIVENEKLVICLLDLVIDPNEQIRRYANLAVDIISEVSPEWRDKVLERRFETANHYWLEFVNNGGLPFQQDDSLNDTYGEHGMGGMGDSRDEYGQSQSADFEYADHSAFSPNPTVWDSSQMAGMNMLSDNDDSLSDYDNQMNHQLRQRY